jgi:heme exporter protein A
MTPHSVAAVEARDLGCVRGGRLVFEKLNFSAGAGSALVLEGPNGAGKTSALRIVAGLLAEAAGGVEARTPQGRVTGREDRGRLCALLGHQDGVKAQLTVAENARFAASLYGARSDGRGALDRVGLLRLQEAPAQYLSAGQRRRLGLARLITSGRPLWLLDEPFAALDAEGRRLVLDLIAAHRAEGGIVIAAMHEPLGIEAMHVTLGTA